MYVTVYTPNKPVLDPSVVVMFFVAVTTVLLAAYIANTPFEFLRCVHQTCITFDSLTQNMRILGCSCEREISLCTVYQFSYECRINSIMLLLLQVWSVVSQEQ